MLHYLYIFVPGNRLHNSPSHSAEHLQYRRQRLNPKTYLHQLQQYNPVASHHHFYHEYGTCGDHQYAVLQNRDLIYKGPYLRPSYGSQLNRCHSYLEYVEPGHPAPHRPSSYATAPNAGIHHKGLDPKVYFQRTYPLAVQLMLMLQNQSGQA